MAVDEAPPKDPRGKVLSKYKVFWNDSSPKQVVVLQFPNRVRTKPYNRASTLQPPRIRFKPNTGLVEVDVPLGSQAKGHFDKEKSLEFGHHLAKNKTIRSGGSFGLAGGFGAGGVSNHNRRAPQVDDITRDPYETVEEAYANAKLDGNVLEYLTLSGKIQMHKDGDPIYAIATFRGDEIHMTRVHAICWLSPQYTHLDAAADNEKATRMREADSGGAVETEARAINISVRSGDAENVPPDDIGKMLRALQEEPWERMQWVDEEDDQAYLAFQNHLFYTGSDDSKTRLVSAMSPESYLDAISAPKLDDKIVGQKIAQRHKASIADDWDESTDEETDVEIMQEEGQRRQAAVN